MGVKYITQATGNSTSATILFSSIPQSYRHLWFVAKMRTTTTNNTDSAFFRPIANNDTATTQLRWQSGSPLNVSGIAFRPTGSYVDQPHPGEFIILNYTRTDRPKVIFQQSGTLTPANQSQSFTTIAVGCRNENSAVSSVNFTISSGALWNSDTIIYLYGIE